MCVCSVCLATQVTFFLTALDGDDDDDVDVDVDDDGDDEDGLMV